MSCFGRKSLHPSTALSSPESIGTIDVAYDLSFLLMDLEVRGLRALANRAMGRYWTYEPSRDLVGLAVDAGVTGERQSKGKCHDRRGASDERARQRALKAAHSFCGSGSFHVGCSAPV